MPSRRRTGLWVVGFAVVAGVTALYVTKGGRGTKPVSSSVTAIDSDTPLADLAGPLGESDPRALTELYKRAMFKADEKPAPLTEAEAAGWVEALKGARAGYLKFGAYGRASALAVVGRVLQRYAAEPAPSQWTAVLTPTQDLLASGLNDGALDVRVQALAEVGKVWSWGPGKPLMSTEEGALATWKDSFTPPVVHRLGDRDPKSRAAAIACLGRMPYDNAAAEAVPYLEDSKSPEVRKQVLVSFATRPALLTNEAVFKHVFDNEAGIPEVVDLILKARGLNQEQISLGSMIFHAKPEIRASVITLIKNRADIDPAVWLLHLSHDGEEMVRLGAVDALAGRLTPEVGHRLAEMAAGDTSSAVRRAASKHVFPEIEKTAAIPPLPGSPSLNPKAN